MHGARFVEATDEVIALREKQGTQQTGKNKPRLICIS